MCAYMYHYKGSIRSVNTYGYSFPCTNKPIYWELDFFLCVSGTPVATRVVYLVIRGHLVASQVVSSHVANSQQAGMPVKAQQEVIQSSGASYNGQKAVLRFHSDPGQNSNTTEQVKMPAADSSPKENICGSLELLWQLFLTQ